MNIQDIKVQRGEKIQPAWERLVRWVDSLKVIPSDGVRVRETPKGTIITVVRERNRHDHPFKVSISDGMVTVSSGTVSGMSPYILDKDTTSWLQIVTQGLGDDKKTPQMSINFKDISRSDFFISVRMVLDDAGNVIDPEENLTIVQTNLGSGNGDGAYYLPLAIAYLNDEKTDVSEIHQIAHHNVNFVYQGSSAANRVLFFAT